MQIDEDDVTVPPAIPAQESPEPPGLVESLLAILGYFIMIGGIVVGLAVLLNTSSDSYEATGLNSTARQVASFQVTVGSIIIMVGGLAQGLMLIGVSKALTYLRSLTNASRRD